MSGTTISLTPASQAQLRRVLVQTKKHCEGSEETGYSHLTTGEVTHQLQAAITCLDEGRLPDFNIISILFAPTCSLQDIAIDNGWGVEFLELAGAFDVAAKQKS